jgi:hypothetical protein
MKNKLFSKDVLIGALIVLLVLVTFAAGYLGKQYNDCRQDACAQVNQQGASYPTISSNNNNDSAQGSTWYEFPFNAELDSKYLNGKKLNMTAVNINDPKVMETVINYAFRKSEATDKYSYTYKGSDGDECTYDYKYSVDKDKDQYSTLEKLSCDDGSRKTQITGSVEPALFNDIYDNFFQSWKNFPGNSLGSNYETKYSSELVTVNNAKSVKYTMNFKRQQPNASGFITKVYADVALDESKIEIVISEDGHIQSIKLPKAFSSVTYAFNYRS